MTAAITAPDTEILTDRLLLRPLAQTDAPAIRRLAGDERVARFTARIPHPYPEGEAKAFIAAARRSDLSGEARHFAIALRDEPGTAIGVIMLEDRPDGTVELGYWLGVPYWGGGLMSETVAAVVDFARRWRPGVTIRTHTFPDNVASQRVLEKVGFARRGTGVCEAPARACSRVEDAPIFVLEPNEAA